MNTINSGKLEFWFVAGSQHLYGSDVLKTVASHAQEMAGALKKSIKLPCGITAKEVMTTPDSITDLCMKANADRNCAGLILWMHTFSPARMWIRGLTQLNKPFLHLHTQFNREIPWQDIDMDFMNLNQSAHGDREAGHLHSRLRLSRKVISGFWQDKDVQHRIERWMRVALAWNDWQGGKVARFGDNMRQVAVTEGDKVAAEIKLGMSVNGYGVGNLVEHIKAVGDKDALALCDEYDSTYAVSRDLGRKGVRRDSLVDAARIELGMRSFLEKGNFKAFTTTFEDLTGIKQLPGLACQRLMADGYGFGAEGDWKTAALVRALKVMGAGLSGGASFMEDYTYHFGKDETLVLGAHMLEVCPTLTSKKPSLEIHPLGIGGKDDPCRLVFDADAGPAINVSLVDLGNRFRLIVNEVEVVKPGKSLPKLPVARALWRCKPDFRTSTEGWILGGGAHHTVLSYSMTVDDIRDFAEMAGIELVVIDAGSDIVRIKNLLKVNEVYFHMSNGLCRM